MGEPAARPGTYTHFFIWTLVLAGLYLTNRYSFLLFYNLAGFFGVVIAAGVFIIARNSRGFLENNYLLFLGISYLFVGTLDLLHTLAYDSMRVFPGFGANLPNHLWVAAQGLESLSLGLAPLCLGRRLHPGAIFGGCLLAFAVIILVVFVWPLLPVSPGTADPGLIALGKTADRLTSVILLGGMALLWRRRQEFEPEVLRLLLGAIALAVGSEVALTFGGKVSN